MNNRTTQQQAQECAIRFLLGEMVPPFFDHIKILIPGFLKHVLLKSVQKGCCSKTGPGYLCGHCRNSLRVLIISRAIILSLHELPTELHATEELNTLCSWVREEVINFNIIKSCNDIRSILPDKMSKLIIGCTSTNTIKPPLNQWGDDIARILQPISSHWCIRVKLLMHMGYRVTLVDFDNVAIFAQKELSAVCSDVSQLLCPTTGRDDDKVNSHSSSLKGSDQCNPTAKERPLHNQKLSYSELSTQLKNAQDIINKKDQIIQDKNAILAEQFAVIERFKSIHIQDTNSTKGGDDISPPPTAKERPLDKQTKQKLEQLMNESNSGETESTSVSTATAPQQQHSNIMSSRGAAIVPCRARDMPVDHNFKTAYFVIPNGIEHGDELLCSYPACRQAGVKFRYCLQCRVPVAKRNFRNRHRHGVPGEEDEWEDEDSEEETNQDVCRTVKPLPIETDTKLSSLDIDEQIQPNESNGGMGSQPVDFKMPDIDELDDGFVIRTPSQPTSGEAGIRQLKPEVTKEDANLYLDKVKLESPPNIYNGFLKIMKDLQEKKIDTIGTINHVRRLFHENNDMDLGWNNNMVLGFNRFLPNGYSIEMKTEDTEPVFIVPSPRLPDTSVKDMEETQQKVEQLAIESKVSIKDRKSDTNYNAKHNNGSPPQASTSMNDNDEPDDDFVIRTPSSGGAPIGPKPELKREDAILYINQAKLEFKDRPHIYDEFLKTAKEFKEQKVDEIGVINRVRRLFHGHNDLILGFNNYLPVGYSIEMKTEYTEPIMRSSGQDLPSQNTDSFNEFQDKIKVIGRTLPAEEKKTDRVEQQQTESVSQSSTTARGKVLKTVDDSSDSSSSDSDDSDYDYMNILNKPPKKGGWTPGGAAAERAAEAAEIAAENEKEWPQLKAVDTTK